MVRKIQERLRLPPTIVTHDPRRQVPNLQTQTSSSATWTQSHHPTTSGLRTTLSIENLRLNPFISISSKSIHHCEITLDGQPYIPRNLITLVSRYDYILARLFLTGFVLPKDTSSCCRRHKITLCLQSPFPSLSRTYCDKIVTCSTRLSRHNRAPWCQRSQGAQKSPGASA